MEAGAIPHTPKPKALSARASGRRAGVRTIDTRQRQRLFGLWKDLSPSLGIEAATDREARIAYANQKLSTRITSWSELTRVEASKLIYHLRQDLGRSPGTRGAFIAAKIAAELYGPQWDPMLAERLERRPYFHFGRLEDLEPRRMHGLIEELLDHLVQRYMECGSSAAAFESGSKLPHSTERKSLKEELRKRFRKF